MSDGPAATEHRRPWRLAHRGDWRVAPENSLAAMIAALAVPACDGLEFDIRGSADGVPVLLHDRSLARVQRLDAEVGDLTAAELAAHGVPTLASVLAEARAPGARRADGRAPFLDVELKGEPVPAVVGVLEAGLGPGLERAVVSSFEAATLAWLGDRRPAWPRWLNTVDLERATLGQAVSLGCAGVSVAWTAIDEPGLGAARALGLEVAAWTVREPSAYRRLAERGVIAICAEAAALDGVG